jgi:hypothetical protein
VVSASPPCIRGYLSAAATARGGPGQLVAACCRCSAEALPVAEVGAHQDIQEAAVVGHLEVGALTDETVGIAYNLD